MSIAESTETYEYDAKSDWRNYIHNEMFNRSYNVENGLLKNKWLEPVGKDAHTFRELLSKNIITESQLIGLDYNPNSPTYSEANIHNCQSLFGEATFHNKLWTSFCYEYEGDDIEYIVYDLFTSTHGKEFENNIYATFDLVKKCLTNIDHVILAINADLGIAKRHNKSLAEYENLIGKLIKRSKLPEIKINTEDIFTYQNTKSSTTMGLIVVEFE
jgi:hypothetical protein